VINESEAKIKRDLDKARFGCLSAHFADVLNNFYFNEHGIDDKWDRLNMKITNGNKLNAIWKD
jgi:hypothetical protein